MTELSDIRTGKQNVAEKSVYERLPIYYGWIILLMTLLTYMTMFGLRYSIGVFFVPLKKEFGWTTATTASAVTIFYWVYGLSAPFSGRLAEKIGSRKTIVLGGLLLGLGGILGSQILEIWHLYLFWGVIAALGSAALYVVPTTILTRFFEKHRGKAVGWASIGISLGQTLMVPFAGRLTEEYGWRTAFLLLSIIVIAVDCIIGFIIFRDSPTSIGLKVDGRKSESDSRYRTETSSTEQWTLREALGTVSFKYVALSYFFVFGAFASLLLFVIPHTLRLGINPTTAAYAFGFIGLMSAVGSFLFGLISDRVGRKTTIIVTSLGLAASMYLVATIPRDIFAVYAWAVFYGLVYGGSPEQYSAIITDYFGERHSPTLLGFVMAAGGIGGGLFPLIGGYIVDMTGDYSGTLIFLGTLACLGTIFALPMKRPRRRR